MAATDHLIIALDRALFFMAGAVAAVVLMVVWS